MTFTRMFDFIVIGAGSSGAVVAGRLAQARAGSVLLVEAGGKDPWGITRIPAATYFTVGNPNYDWNFISEPDPSRQGRSETWPRGKVVGGSSSINGMIYVRGDRSDFDAWRDLGNPGWGYEDVLPLFRRLETSDIVDNQFRGNLGPQHVSRLRYIHPLTHAFIDAAVEAGIPRNEDINGLVQEGVGYVQAAQFHGKRESSYDAFCRSLVKSGEIDLMTSTLVTRIVIQSGKAVGIQVSADGKAEMIGARREVILSAGALNSPQLLMLSGIGPSDQLRRFNIPVVADRPGVGRNMMEHPCVFLKMEMNETTLNTEALPWKRPLMAADWLVRKRGPLTTPTAQAYAFKTTDGGSTPDVQLHFLAHSVMQRNGRRYLPPESLAMIAANVSHPESRGHIELRSADAAEKVKIFPRLLDSDADVDCQIRGYRLARRVAAVPGFAARINRLVDAPDPQASDDELRDYVRSTAVPIYHIAGTCRMGSDADSIVDPQLRVRGVEGLRIADASVFPRHVSGNTNATTLMIGEKAAELIQNS